MQPLRITAYPLSPIVSDELLSLDGVLFYFAMQKRHGMQVATLSGAVAPDICMDVDIPLAKTGGTEWYYAISSAQWDNHTHGQSFWTKRFDARNAERMVDFKGKRGKIQTSEGRYKGYKMPIFTRHALRVCWYAMGDRQGVEDLLSNCTHIGKKIAHGWGRVLWRVEDWHADWSVWKNGQLMRPVPSEDDRGILYGIRPPYWLAENQVHCQLP